MQEEKIKAKRLVVEVGREGTREGRREGREEDIPLV